MDLAHGLGGARGAGRRQDVQVAQIADIVVDVALRELERIFLELIGAGDDLVVHVGVVHDVPHFVAPILQIAADDVEDQRRHGVTHMRPVVDRHAADVHPDDVRLEGGELFLLAGESVVDAQHV